MLRHAIPFTAMLWAVTIVTREPNEGDLRLGQRVYVDDGTCPAGQIKEVAGAKMTSSAVWIRRFIVRVFDSNGISVG